MLKYIKLFTLSYCVHVVFADQTRAVDHDQVDVAEVPLSTNAADMILKVIR